MTLYGVIDEGVNFLTNAGGHHLWQTASSVMQGDRLGFKGSEDLGGGTKAIFTLESGFDVNTGGFQQGNRFLGRQAFVGLSSNIGTITLGRQYDPAVDYVQPLSNVVTMASYGGHPGDNDNLQDNFRVNNTVKIRSATYGGASVEGMYAFSNTAGGFNQNSAWGLGGGYSAGAVSLGLGLLRLEHPGSNTNGAVGGSGGTTTSDYVALANRFVSGAINNELIAEGAILYSMSKGTLGFVYSHVRYDLAASPVTFSNYEFDGTWWFTPAFRFGGTYTYTDGDVAVTGESPKYHQLSFVLDYFLSKRTDVYMMLIGQKAIGTYAQVTNVAASNTDKQLVARIGIRTKF